MNDAGDKHNRVSEVRKRAKQRGDSVESLLRSAGAMREQQVAPSLTLFGELQPQFTAGDKVQVRIEDGSWVGGLRAVSGIEEIEDEAGTLQKVIRVSWEDEWHAAQRDGSKPTGIPWPYAQVEFWEPAWTSNMDPNQVLAVQQAAEHSTEIYPPSYTGISQVQPIDALTTDSAELSRSSAQLPNSGRGIRSPQRAGVGLPRGRGDRYVPRRKVCSFCVDRVEEIDYQDVVRLRRYLSERNMVEPRRKTGTCARHQRSLSVAIKRARHTGLLPDVGLAAHNMAGAPDKD